MKTARYADNNFTILRLLLALMVHPASLL